MYQVRPRTLRPSVALLIILGLLLTVQLTGKTNDEVGAVNGYVFTQDSHGRQILIRDASVYIVLPETYRHEHVSPPVAHRVTNSDGFYVFLGLLPGRYYVVAQAKGYYGNCWPKLVVIPNSLARVNLRMGTHRVLARCHHQDWPDEGVMF